MICDPTATVGVPVIDDADIHYLPPADVAEAAQSWKVQPVVDGVVLVGTFASGLEMAIRRGRVPPFLAFLLPAAAGVGAILGVEGQHDHTSRAGRLY